MSNDNPYASPSTVGNSAAAATHSGLVDGELVLASKTRRFVNFIVDRIAALVCEVILGVLLAVIALATENDALLSALEGPLGTILSLLVYAMYLIVFEAAFGRTPGKMLTGTMVVNEHGEHPRFGQVVGRTLARFIPFEPFSAFGLPRSRPWHDSLSKTRVVRLERK